MKYALLPFRRILDFSSRSRRREYWHFVVLLIVVFILAALLDVYFGLGGALTASAQNLNFSINLRGGLLAKVWGILTLVPGIGLSVRRLHDTNRTGWWMLIVLIPLFGWIAWIVFMCLDGRVGRNRFGPSPKDMEAVS